MGAYGMPDNFDEWAVRGPGGRDDYRLFCDVCEREILDGEKRYAAPARFGFSGVEIYCAGCAEKGDVTEEVK